MSAKWFCNKCGKEIWQELNQNDKEEKSVSELEEECFCSDCQRVTIKNENLDLI